VGLDGLAYFGIGIRLHVSHVRQYLRSIMGLAVARSSGGGVGWQSRTL